jgi:hypothetical protein
MNGHSLEVNMLFLHADQLLVAIFSRKTICTLKQGTSEIEIRRNCGAIFFCRVPEKYR